MTDERQNYALVMKGGGLKGLACIGALRELQRFYGFDLYVGTSAGAIIASLLGAGYSADEMEEILRTKNFSEFLTERFRAVTNLLFYGGLFQGTALSAWIEGLLATKLDSPTRVTFQQLPYHVRIYASRRDVDALIFDSIVSPDMSVAHAVRCSVAIPFFFTPERNQGLNVFDGGMRHNYPVKKLLEQTPDKKFIGLYLGDRIYSPPKPGILRDLLSISTEATDTEALAKYRAETIVIDPKPVSTLDFSLSNEEKVHLLSQGRAAALEFLHNNGLVGQTEFRNAVEVADRRREEALTARAKRKFWTRLTRGLWLTALTVMFAVPLLVIYRSEFGLVADKAHYRDIARRNGEWIGVDPITKRHVSGLNSHYEVTYEGKPRRPKTISQKNGSGSLAGGLIGVANDTYEGECSTALVSSLLLSYKSDGSIDSEILHDQNSIEVENIQYPSPVVGQFLNATFPCDHGGSGIRVVRFERDPIGKQETVSFLDKDRNPRPNVNGVYGERRTYDESGRTIYVTSLGPSFENWNGNKGYASVQYSHNSGGLKLSEEYFARDGTKTLSKDGIAKTLYSYDSLGNEIETRYLNLAGNLTPSVKLGAAIIRSKYDERGNLVEQTHFGADHKPVVTKQNYWRVLTKYDDRGFRSETSFFDAENRPTLESDGYASWHSKRDKRLNPYEESRFGSDGLPIYGKEEGKSEHTLYKHDERSNIIEQKHLGKNREPVLLKDGVAIARFTYSATNKKKTADYFDVNAQPTLSTDGYSSWQSTFDERGNELKTSHFGIKGQPVLTAQGISSWQNKYDANGRRVETIYIGLDNQPLADESGVTIVRSQYDQRGNQIHRTYFNADQQPVGDSDGVHMYQYKYDDRDRKVEAWTYNPEGKLLGGGTRSQYDDRGNAIETVFHDELSQPNLVAKHEYDERDRELVRRYFGSDGKLTFNSEGVAGGRHKYDSRGNKSEITLFGLDGNIASNLTGLATIRMKHNEKDQLIERVTLDSSGTPKLIDGYAFSRMLYDDRGNEIEKRYLDTLANLVEIDGGFAIERSKFNERKQLLETAYFDINDKAVAGKLGWAVATNEYNALGLHVVRRFFGVDRSPVASIHSGRSIVRYTYDDRYLTTEEASFDSNDRPVNRLDELWHKKSMIYDANGKLQKTVLTTTDGGVVAQK